MSITYGVNRSPKTISSRIVGMRPARSINSPMDKMRKASLRKRKGQNVTSFTGRTHTHSWT